jgi:guanylate kinase
MPRLLLVAGASGAGKTFLLENVAVIDSSVRIIKKLTTREPRPFELQRPPELLDLHFSRPLSEVQACDYRYHYAKDWYGIQRAEIDAVLKAGMDPILIVRNGATIRELKRTYKDAVVIYLQSALSGEDLRGKLQKQGRTDLDIEERMRRMDNDFHDYVSNVDLFGHVIINYYEQDTLIEQMQRVLAENRETAIRPGSIFVLMSFDAAMNATYRAIENAAKLVPTGNLKVDRVDKARGAYRITERILDSIARAALIVCDLTQERPNVYYELGFARGIGKTVIPCANAGTTLHFDIKDFRTIFYLTPLDLQDALVKEFEDHFVV